MSKSSGEGDILIIKQVAEYLRATEHAIYRLADAKKVRAFNVGGTWRLSRARIDNWIRQQLLAGLDAGRDEVGTSTGRAKGSRANAGTDLTRTIPGYPQDILLHEGGKAAGLFQLRITWEIR